MNLSPTRIAFSDLPHHVYTKGGIMFQRPPRGASKAAQLGIPKPLRAIRIKCLDCTCGSDVEVRECGIKDCALWPYRMGKYPKVSK